MPATASPSLRLPLPCRTPPRPLNYLVEPAQRAVGADVRRRAAALDLDKQAEAGIAPQPSGVNSGSARRSPQGVGPALIATRSAHLGRALFQECGWCGSAAPPSPGLARARVLVS